MVEDTQEHRSKSVLDLVSYERIFTRADFLIRIFIGTLFKVYYYNNYVCHVRGCYSLVTVTATALSAELKPREQVLWDKPYLTWIDTLLPSQYWKVHCLLQHLHRGRGDKGKDAYLSLPYWQHWRRTLSAWVGFTSMGSTRSGRITSPSGGSRICFCDTIRYISANKQTNNEKMIFFFYYFGSHKDWNMKVLWFDSSRTVQEKCNAK